MSNLRDHLQSIYTARGELTPRIVVDEASAPDHPLHHRFEWDDTVAGKRYREAQAAELIRSVKITYRTRTGEPGQINAFQVTRRPEGSTYIPVEEVVQDEFTTKILLADMRRDWEAFKRRYQHLAEFVELVRQGVA